MSGNHDAEGDLDTGLMYQAFENRFRMPQVEKAIIGKVTKKQDVDLNKMYQLPYDFGNSFYSYSNGMTHNIVLNAFADFEPGSNQYNWLVQDLKVNRSIYPWVLVLVCYCLLIVGIATRIYYNLTVLQTSISAIIIGPFSNLQHFFAASE